MVPASHEIGPRVLNAARALGPQIRASADTIEQHQRLPDSLVDAMASAGLFKMLVPREFGGGEVDPETCIRVIEEVARGDGSAGWCVMLPATVGASAGSFDEATARDIFGDDRAYVVASVLPGGRAQAVDGGYRVSGRWSFASGCRHATWIGGVSGVYEGDAPRLGPNGIPETRLLFFPASDCTIIDAWDVIGLRGSGSHDFAVTDVFVPQERSLPRSTPVQPRHSSRLYAFAAGVVPLSPTSAGANSSAWAGVGSVGFGAVSLGIARGALDAFAELANVKTPTGGRILLRDDPVVQMQVGQAEATLRTVRAFLYETIRDIWLTVRETGGSTAEQQILLRLAGAHAATLSAHVVEVVWKAAGASSIFATNPLERRFRDVHVATQNIAVGPTAYGLAGRMFLGPDLTTSQD